MSPEIERRDRISLHVYRERGGRHHRAHAHVRRLDGEPTTVVGLPLLDVIIGPQITGAEMQVLLECLQRLLHAWEELNG
jgi:hypothetical protein